MKKCVDNKADLFSKFLVLFLFQFFCLFLFYLILKDNTDPTNLESLQALRNELAAKYFKNQLDSYSLYIYGVVLSKLKLIDEAINILVESVKKRPTLWCAWLELANLIKSIETVIKFNSFIF